jgi:DNA modification methylase
MAVNSQVITDRYAIYNGDAVDVLRAIPDEKIHLSIYSPPFTTSTGGLYNYSSSDRDLSNCPSAEVFFEHYDFVVREIARVTMPGRMTAVHCMDIPNGNSGNGMDCLIDFPGDIIRQHERLGFRYVARYVVWKEPLGVRNRTMAKKLTHSQIVDDSSLCTVASADYLLVFRRHGENKIPITHEHGLMDYAGSRAVPPELLRYRGWEGNQIENRYSQWIWRQYASAFWDDVRIERVLPFKYGKDENDEKHVNALQLDVIDRILELWSNPGETVLTPFLGCGSEVYAALMAGRKGIGAELKPSYFRQAAKNVASAYDGRVTRQEQISLELDDANADLVGPDLNNDHRKLPTPVTRMKVVV